MELYTYHPLTFNLVADTVALERSECYNDKYEEIREKFRKAYDFLFNQTGRKDNIWCYGFPCMYASSDNKVQNFEPQRLWVLNVPDRHIIAVDSTIWDFAINNWYYLDDPVYSALTAHIADDDGKKQDRFDALIAELYDHAPCNSYKGLIKPLKEADIFHDQFLIPSPIKKHWVVRTFIIEAEQRIKNGNKNL